ncbi:MAG: lipid-A-disaccharide synthase [Epsilonproteobacteria bacterium]|nr:lipid-A-disaccharide synthase [Campylobacterota bacterium]
MKILVSALETSSNIHLKALMDEVFCGIELVGIFDKSLGDPTYDISDMAVMGFVDVIKKIPFFLKLKKEMVGLARDVDKVLLMDNSGFNLPLAKAIKKAYPDKEIIYYILPQAWAWKKGRITVIEEVIDTICSILPFEKSYYPKNTKLQYVGHPLLDEIKNFRDTTTNSGKIAFMPGSRRGEITKLLPIYKEVAKQIDKEAILIIPKHFSDKFISDIYGDISMFTIEKNPYDTLFEVDFAFICSGTATLEAALIGTPFILTYIAKPFDYFVAKRLIKIDFIGLANIFFTKMKRGKMHTELLQEDVNSENLLSEYQKIDSKKFLENSIILRDYLSHGSSKNMAQILCM